MVSDACLFLGIWILKMEAANSRHNGNYLAVNRASYPRRLEASTW